MKKLNQFLRKAQVAILSTSPDLLDIHIQVRLKAFPRG
jgi:hypothetical protein